MSRWTDQGPFARRLKTTGNSSQEKNDYLTEVQVLIDGEGSDSAMGIT